MLTREICQDCERIFIGGPKAFLCPACRKKRQSENAKRIHKKRAEAKKNDK